MVVTVNVAKLSATSMSSSDLREEKRRWENRIDGLNVSPSCHIRMTHSVHPNQEGTESDSKDDPPSPGQDHESIEQVGHHDSSDSHGLSISLAHIKLRLTVDISY